MVGPNDRWDDGWHATPEAADQSSSVDITHVQTGLATAVEYLEVSTQPIPAQAPVIIETSTFTEGLLDTKPLPIITSDMLEGAQQNA